MKAIGWQPGDDWEFLELFVSLGFVQGTSTENHGFYTRIWKFPLEFSIN
jgi:hypothetical protein